jgi:hypothetical protein
MASDYEGAGLKAVYADALGAIRQSLKMRNSLAHSHWADLALAPSYETYSLFYVALGDAALAAESFEYKWMQAEITLLKEMEGYCGYARQALMYLQWEWEIRKGTRAHNAIPKPTKQKPPIPRTAEDPDILRRLPKST